MRSNLSSFRFNLTHVLISVVLAFLLVSAGIYYYYSVEKEALKKGKSQDLSTVATLKTDHISNWYRDKLSDADTISKDVFLISVVNDWLKSGDEKDRKKLKDYLKIVADEHDYDNISITSGEGELLFSSDEKVNSLEDIHRDHISAALKSGKTLSTGLYKCNVHDEIQLAFVSFLKIERPDLNPVLIFEIDPDNFLYSLVETWPIESPTSETFIFRIEKDSILFLNDLRHRDNTALEFRLPTDHPDLPAGMAASGYKGIVEGKDYRGTPVLAYVSDIPDTNWYMVAKVDKDEVYAGLLNKTAVFTVFSLLLILLIGSVVTALYTFRQRNMYRAMWLAEEEFRVTLYSIGDGVISTDKEGKVKYMNSVAEKLTGWEEEDARGRHLEEVFKIVDEQTRSEVRNPVQKVLEEGTISGLANHTILVSRNGEEIPIADCGAPVKDTSGEIRGIVLVFIDHSAERESARKLKESENKLKEVFRVSPAILYKSDHEFLQPKWMSENITTILGYTVDETLKSDWWENNIHPDDRAEALENFRKINTERHVTHEYRFRKENGEWIWIRDEFILVEEEKPNQSVIVGAWVDITDRKIAEEALKINEQRYHELFESNPFPMFVYEIDTLRILEVNNSAVVHYGYTREEFTSMTLRDLHPEDQIPALLENVANVDEGIDRAGIWRHILKDGRIIYVEITSHTIMYEGRRAEVVLAYDVTDRRIAEDALHRSQNLLRATLDSLTEAVFMVNPGDRTIELCNRAACRMFGYSREELTGKNTLKLHVDEEHYNEFGRLSTEMLDSGRRYLGEFEMKRADGEIFPTEHEVCSVSTEMNKHAGVVSVVRDITDRKKSELEKEKLESRLRQAQKMESIGRLAGGVAHDFNNMLQAMYGYIELSLSKVDPSDSLYDDLKEIQKAAMRSATLTKQLLVFARQQSVKGIVLDLNDTVSGMLKMLQRLMGEDIELVWVPGLNLWNVKMDPDQINQILVNLCANAHDAIVGNGRVTIETGNVTTDEAYNNIYPYFEPGEYVLLSVSDNGCGMEKAVLENIFEPFYTTKETGKGTGLGLATVYGIVKQNNGYIHVYSEPGKGTIVKIYLPRHHAEITEQVPQQVSETIKGSGETILLVEDEAAILQMGKMVLEELGYRVLTAEKPEDAIKLAEQYGNGIDLVITDVIMPEMNGKELADIIRQRIGDIKCIYMSGYTSKFITRDLDLMDNEYFIQKPFSVNSLSRMVSEALEGSA